MNAKDFESLFTPLTEEEFRERISVHITRRSKYGREERVLLDYLLNCANCYYLNNDVVCRECESTYLRRHRKYMKGNSSDIIELAQCTELLNLREPLHRFIKRQQINECRNL